NRERRLKGNKLAWCMVGLPSELLEVFEVDAVWPENYSTACAAKQSAVDFIEVAESEGYSPDICSYARCSLGYLREEKRLGSVPPNAPQGGMPEPDMLIAPSLVCDVRLKWFQAIGTRFMNVPMHVMEIQGVPYGVNVDDENIREHYVRLYVAGLEETVRFLENQTGKKLDNRRLSTAIANSQEAQRLFYEVHELRKGIPSPMPSEDYFACIVPQLYMLGTSFAVDFYRNLLEEVRQRVRSGIGVIPDEKCRLLWVGLPPWFNMGIFNYLESAGAVSVMETCYYVGKPLQIDPSDGLRALAERAWLRATEMQELGAEVCPENARPGYGIGGAPLNLVTQFVREYKIDAVVMHLTMSCRVLSFGQAHVANELRHQNVPVLTIESDMADPRSWADAEIKGRIHSLVEMLKKR
ncbi:2-hydroxyacyl-CoA dehydratase subunit D, partial [Chloroflexota bacterium]